MDLQTRKLVVSFKSWSTSKAHRLWMSFSSYLKEHHSLSDKGQDSGHLGIVPDPFPPMHMMVNQFADCVCLGIVSNLKPCADAKYNVRVIGP